MDRYYISDPRVDHDYRYAIDVAKLENHGWKSKRDPENQITEIVQWCYNCQKWWKKRREEAEKIH